MGTEAPAKRPPVAIGGVGGSGTRAIAQILLELGFDLGADLNAQKDNLWFTLLFKRTETPGLSREQFEELAALFLKAMRPSGAPATAQQRELLLDFARRDRRQHSSEWLRDRAATLRAATAEPCRGSRRWGWKEPNSHIVIERWLRFAPDLKYVHVIRNGLDMAYSGNQNQLDFWGAHVLGTDTPYSPRESLRFWCATHRRILELMGAYPERILLLSFDRLCREPEKVLRSLLEFVHVEPTAAVLERLSRGVTSPPGMGRFKPHGLAGFDPADVRFVRALGFDTRPD